MQFWKRLGPGLLVTAAFIGPGTVTAASTAGAGFGFALLWAVVFAIVATIVLQEMAARLGLVSRQGMGEAVRSTFHHPIARLAACALVIAAIAFGNAAYQTGNIIGASVGLHVICGAPIWLWSLLVGAAAFALLASGTYKLIERVLVVLVVLMSVVFVLTALIVKPDLGGLVRGLVVPTIPEGSLLTILGLIGTTVVPYNLFLHASSVREKWSDAVPIDDALRESRWDTTLSIGLGGIVTLAVVATAAAAFFPGGKITNAADFARQLEPLLGGRAAKVFFACGFLAAGMTSSITAPLAAAFATSGALGWEVDLKSWRFRGVWFSVLVVGVVLAVTLGKSPTQTILVAQVANGLLLPFVAVFLIMAVNRSELMGKYKNGIWANCLGVLVTLIAAGLGIYKVVEQLGLIAT
jgi:manganese transport protein